MESPTSTFALLEQAKSGDEQALSRAFERHRRRLAVLIHYKLSPRAQEFCEVEDLVQETCLRAAVFPRAVPGGPRLMDEARERQLADALAHMMDGEARGDAATLSQFPELAGGPDALAGIDSRTWP